MMITVFAFSQIFRRFRQIHKNRWNFLTSTTINRLWNPTWIFLGFTEIDHSLCHARPSLDVNLRDFSVCDACSLIERFLFYFFYIFLNLVPVCKRWCLLLCLLGGCSLNSFENIFKLKAVLIYLQLVRAYGEFFFSKTNCLLYDS